MNTDVQQHLEAPDRQLDAAERAELRALSAKLASDFSGTEVPHAGSPPDWRPMWRSLAVEAGLTGLAVPEAFGGAGCSFAEVGAVLAELGRHLAGGPYLATVGLAIPALIASGDESACRDLLPDLAAGARIATVACAGERGDVSAGHPQVAATRRGPGWVLEGSAAFVLNGDAADVLLLAAAASNEPGPSLFAVDLRGRGVQRSDMRSLDPTRPLSRFLLSGAPATVVGAPGSAGSTLHAALDVASAAQAAEAVGSAAHVLDRTVEYVSQRRQFGRPIGSFQAIKHKCARMLLDVESSRSVADAALRATHRGGGGHEASIAKAYVGEAFFRVASEAIQAHGGIGFTWEHGLHLYFRRAKSNQVVLGNARWHEERVLRDLGV